MESLNNDMNNMDDLFRRAAENYPLKPGNEDWENISTKLLAKGDTAGLIKKNKFRKYTGFLLFLFLISASLFLYSEFQNEDNHSSRIKENKKPLNENRRSLAHPADNNNTNILKTGLNGSSISKDRSVSAKKTQNETQTRETIYSGIVSIKTGKRMIELYDHSVMGRLSSFPISNTSSGDISIISPALTRKTVHPSVLFQTGNTDELSKQDLLDSNKDNDKTLKSHNTNGLYLGLTAGLDFSKIKSQGIDRTGYNLGFLAGYRFNRKLSVESGILWSRKEYYTDGKYFNMKAGSAMPVNMKIVNVQGQLASFEIPLKIKYDLLLREKSNLFISTGISSNIYVKEQNNYLLETNGVQQYQIGLYKEVFYSWISLVNISAGYERALGKSYTLRLEPYIKIPIKKVGVGNLPVFSTGMNLSVLNLFSKKKT